MLWYQKHHWKSVWMVLLYGCILAEDGGWCAMMIIVNHPLRLDWFVWMMVMLVLVFGEGVVMVYCMVWCGWEVDINRSKEE